MRAANVTAGFGRFREIELAHLTLSDITLDHDRRTATLRLSVSKTDPQAHGCQRTWGCVCPADGSPVPCGYHAVAAAVAEHERCGATEEVDGNTLLFPDGSGNVCSNTGVVRTLVLWL